MVDEVTQRTSRLLRSHGGALILYSQQWCQTPEDIVQESFLRLLKQSPYPDNPVAWLFRVVRNQSLNAGRSAARRSRHESAAARQATTWFFQPAEAKIDAAEAQRALELLPGELRETIVARLWGDLSFEEIAALTDTSASTAHRRYTQGLQTLRSKMGVPCTIHKTDSTAEATHLAPGRRTHN